jgi:hypothetical protein
MRAIGAAHPAVPTVGRATRRRTRSRENRVKGSPDRALTRPASGALRSAWRPARARHFQESLCLNFLDLGGAGDVDALMSGNATVDRRSTKSRIKPSLRSCQASAGRSNPGRVAKTNGTRKPAHRMARPSIRSKSSPRRSRCRQPGRLARPPREHANRNASLALESLAKLRQRPVATKKTSVPLRAEQCDVRAVGADPLGAFRGSVAA